ncbi:glycoside hydrolase family 28 protein [Celerinatantimonas yamalensis]|uniref:Glycosyl hydrolase family 28 protein n=1 Tax=Celerinatantimonas yamalensis TaxID=559956 RepID=A0ABW9GB46_9GAMM
MHITRLLKVAVISTLLTAYSSVYASVTDVIKLSTPTASVDSHNAVLIWSAPSNETAIDDYQVLDDGKIIATTSQNNNNNSASYPFIQLFQNKYQGDHFTQKVIWQNATITGLHPNQNYHFQVQALNNHHQVIATSNTLSVTTTTTPKVINITHYGAQGDGHFLNTQAIQNTINSCSSNCVVEIPAGQFVTGALFLHSNMTLQLDQGAELIGSTNSANYPSINGTPAALINVQASSQTPAKKYQNIRIVGQGSIDGQGWKTTPGYKNYSGDTQQHYLHGSNTLYSTYGLLAKSQVDSCVNSGMSVHSAYSKCRSNLLYVRKATNFYMQGVTLKNPSYHGIVSSSTKNMTLNSVRVQTYDVNNGDGIDVSRSDNTTVFNSYFDVGDDAINFAAGAGAKAAKENGVNGAWLFNNFIAHAHGGIVLGSRTGSGIQGILAENNVLVGTQVGLRAKSADDIGGGASDITFRNTAMAGLTRNAIEVTLQYGDPNGTSSYKAASKPAQFSNFHISHVSVNTITGTKPSIFIVGDFHHKTGHRQLMFDDVRFNQVMPTDIEDLSDSQFNHVTFTHLKQGNDPWHFRHVSQVTVDDKEVQALN